MDIQEKQYDFATSQIVARTNGPIDAFKMFIQLYTALAGGSIWLSMQDAVSAQQRCTYGRLTDIVAVLIAVVPFILVVENLRGWRNYRRLLTQVVGKDSNGNDIVPEPSIVRSAAVEFSLMAAIVVATVLFFCFNPFLIASG